MRKFTDKINESVEDKIPRAYDFLTNFSDDPDDDTIYEAMVEFARLHVEAALKTASEKVSLTDFAYEFLQEGADDAIDKESILNAYPLDNIK